GNYNGNDAIVFKLNDGELDSNVATLNLTVNPVNDAPVADDATLATAEDTPLHVDFRSFGTDVDSSALTPSIVDGPQHGVLAINDGGTFTYTPDANYFGAGQVRFKLNDGELDSNIATLGLTVTPVNDAPVAANAALTTAEDTPLQVDLRNYGSDVDST